MNDDKPKEYIFKICKMCGKKCHDWTKDARCDHCNSSEFKYEILPLDSTNIRDTDQYT